MFKKFIINVDVHAMHIAYGIDHKLCFSLESIIGKCKLKRLMMNYETMFTLTATKTTAS